MHKIEEIGHVKSDITEPKKMIFACEMGIKSPNISYIILNDCFKDGLKNITDFSHLFVIYKLHKTERTDLTTYPGPKSIKNLPNVGIFASRSQYHPNNIGLRLVKLLEVKGNSLMVQGLDAIDGTPVIDIKPYIPHFDRPETFICPKYYSW